LTAGAAGYVLGWRRRHRPRRHPPGRDRRREDSPHQAHGQSRLARRTPHCRRPRPVWRRL